MVNQLQSSGTSSQGLSSVNMLQERVREILRAEKTRGVMTSAASLTFSLTKVSLDELNSSHRSRLCETSFNHGTIRRPEEIAASPATAATTPRFRVLSPPIGPRTLAQT